jgi:hypothetical protein
MRSATKKSVRSRPRLTVDISPALKRRIKVAAAAQDVPVSAYIANVLERVVPAAETVAKGSDGTIASRMIQRAKGLRAAQSNPFSEDSAELIRELGSSVTLNYERRNCRRRKPGTQMGARRTLYR